MRNFLDHVPKANYKNLVKSKLNTYYFFVRIPYRRSIEMRGLSRRSPTDALYFYTIYTTTVKRATKKQALQQ